MEEGKTQALSWSARELISQGNLDKINLVVIKLLERKYAEIDKDFQQINIDTDICQLNDYLVKKRHNEEIKRNIKWLTEGEILKTIYVGTNQNAYGGIVDDASQFHTIVRRMEKRSIFYCKNLKAQKNLKEC